MKKITLIAVLLGSAYYTEAQTGTLKMSSQPDVTVSILKELPKPQYQNAFGTFLVDLSGVNIPVRQLSSQLNSYFELNHDHTFELISEQRDISTGFVHYSYQHLYNNVKINGDLIFLHTKGDKVQYINGQLIATKDLSITSTVDNDKAISIAYNNFGTSENIHQGEVETFFFKEESQETISLRLIKKVNLTTLNPLKSIDFIIDANSGEVLSQLSKVYHADTPSLSATYYRGNKDLTVDSYNGSYRLRDNARGIRTFNGANLKNGVDKDGTFTGAVEYTSSTANFTSSATKPAVEVHWGIKQTYDYFKNRHNRVGFDNKGHIINNYYDAGASMGGDHDNAGAMDEIIKGQEVVGISYGRGGNFMNPVVLLDVAGHEYSHLVIGRNGNGGLDYMNESGALNESFADMFGTAVEFYANDNPNWTSGEGVFKNSANITPNYMRSLSNPNNAPRPQPDTYKGTYWQNTTSTPNNSNDMGGVHTNSGVGNFWFYLLSEGGSGINDKNDSYYVDGISIQKAEKITYTALITSLTPSATYLDAYNATKLAASTIYGANSNEWNQVVNAWYAVGIGSAPASNQNIEIKSKLSVYPNPVSGDEVTIESNLDEELTIEMYDIQGKKVMNSVNMMNRIALNTSSYSKGIYLLKFKSSSGEYTHKLIIK